MRTRKARLPDAGRVHQIICGFAERGVLLPRSFAEICENVRDFTVAEAGGHIIGCGALHLYGSHLTEVRSVAVDAEFQGSGAGRRLVRALLNEAARHGVTCVCLFTRIPGFFARYGFSVATREELPDKIYKDCQHCPKLHNCDEIAMVRGAAFTFAILDAQVIRRPLVTLKSAIGT
ncbi:MAG: N-acetyltransferase [Terriglobales bacterium]